MKWRDPLFILALGLAALALWHLGQRAGRAEALAAARRDSIEATFARSDSLVNELFAAREVAHMLIAQRDSAYRARRTVYRNIVDTVNIHDTVEVRAALEACDLALSACDSVVAAQRHELAIYDTLVTQFRSEVPRLRDLWRDAEQRAQDKPWGIGVTCGVIAGNVGAGYGCAGGVTYRWRLPF